jgi:hypothetical protein
MPIATINIPGIVNCGFSKNSIITKESERKTYNAGKTGNNGAFTGLSRLGSFFLRIKIPKIVKA